MFSSTAGCSWGAPTIPPMEGDRDAKIDDVPWQVSLHDPSFGHFCGGSILSDEWVLTAQHCLQFSNEISVIAGITRQSHSDAGQLRQVIEIIRYPGYASAENGKDIALLRLNEPLDLSTPQAHSIRIASAGEDQPGRMATVSGWGSLNLGEVPDVLQVIEVPIISNDEAEEVYEDIDIGEDQLAAGHLGEGREACQGDSGGPLAVMGESGDWLLAGVVSWGESCAQPEYPGMYARISTFEEWIREQVGGKSGGDGDDEDDPGPEDEPEESEGMLVINEILADANLVDANNDGLADPEDDEFIELVNGGDAELDLGGATIADAVGVRVTLPAGMVLPPGAALVVFGGGSPDISEPFIVGRLFLNNDGDVLTVRAPDGTVLATAAYGPEGGQDQSLVREQEGVDSRLILHLDVADTPASPGTRSDGSPFGG